jgi:NAD(P)-dependent dehydrogenase (short-subunit alcohol dehydrogenase family)
VENKVWLITGTSQGFGRELVRAGLQRGDSIVATSRKPESVASSFPGAADRLLTLPLDLRNPESISAAVKKAIARFGRIDVLVNNAAYGLAGAVEEASDAEISNLFETNVYGLIRVIRAVLPQMRKQRSGHIVNISSIGGLVGFAGWGLYNSTKFAVVGLSEALAKEAAPLGVRVTIVEPGAHRTNFLGNSLATADHVLSDYEATAGQMRAAITQRNGHQPGDPAAAADAIVMAITSANPPLHLVLGSDAYRIANDKVEAFRRELEGWRELTMSTDFKN